jgi:hypothetical protein
MFFNIDKLFGRLKSSPAVTEVSASSIGAVDCSTVPLSATDPKTRVMKILILGTSNSLTREGWVGGLREAIPDAAIENLSVGASSGIHFAQNINMDFSKYDIVFLDSIPNDEQHATHKFDGRGYSHEHFVSRLMFETASTIASQTSVIFLGFCLDDGLIEETNEFRSTKNIARAVGAQFLDLKTLILEFGELIIGEGEELYRDPPHPQTAISRFFGNSIGRVLKARWDELDGLDFPKFEEPQSFRSNFSIWIAEDNYNITDLVVGENSLFKEGFLAVHPNKDITLSDVGVCIGFTINAYKTSSFVELAGPDEILTLRCFFEHREMGIQRRFIAIPNGMRLSRVSALGSATVDTIHAYDSLSAPMPGAPTELSVSRFVFWSGNPDTSWGEQMSSDEDALLLTREVRQQFASGALPFEGTSLTTRKIREALCQEQGGAGIYAMDGTILIYDAVADRCRHESVHLVAASSKIFIMRARFEGPFVHFSAQIGEFTLPLSIRPDGSIGYELPNGQKPPQIRLKSKFTDGVFAVQCNGRYLAAEPAGKLVCDRLRQGDWELFSIGPRLS